MLAKRKRNESENMKDYVAKIDGGEGGETVIRAGSAALALAEAIEWARGGEWDEGGINVAVAVEADDDASDAASYTLYIPSTEEERDATIEKDGVEIARREGEFSTFKIILMDGGEAYLMHPNGGSRGAWDRRGGDGVWRDYPVSPTERITRAKARELMLDWGYDPSAVARATREIV